MFTGVTYRAGVLVSTLAMLTGTALVHSGPAAADPTQDEQFLRLLEQDEIPAVENAPSVIAAAHKVCGKLDGGMQAADVLDGLTRDAAGMDPGLSEFPDRLRTTMSRFITASVATYCPYDQSRIGSVVASAATQPKITRTYQVVNARDGQRRQMVIAPAAVQEAVRTAALIEIPTGNVRPTDPPRIPAPPPAAPPATPPRAKAAPPAPHQRPAPQQLPPPPQQPPPPPQQPQQPPPQQMEPAPEELPPPTQQAAPPAEAPPAGGTDSGGNGGDGSGTAGGGNGGSGGDGGADAPAGPGFIRLVP